MEAVDVVTACAVLRIVQHVTLVRIGLTERKKKRRRKTMMIRVPNEIREAIKTDKEREAIEAAFGLKQSYYEARGYSRAAATERAWCSLIQDLPNKFNWN
jgi:hypothetical protein